MIERNTLKTLKKTNYQSEALVQQLLKRQSARTKKITPVLFDGILYLKSGQVCDLYRDINDLFSYYHQKKRQL